MPADQPQAVLYLRVSHANRSVSVQDQERECRAICARNDWPIRATFTDDGISASRYGGERPAWQALKSELRSGDILVVWEASRSARDLGDYLELRELCADRGVKLSYSGKLFDLTKGDDRFTSGIDALFSERESEIIKDRVLRGKRAAAADGKPSGPAPWGYRQKVVNGVPVPRVWEHDPDEAPRVREVAKRYLAGDSQASILRWMTETSGWTPHGGSALRRAILNPAYAGLRVHQGEVVGPGDWPPILTVEQHEGLKARIKGSQAARGWVSPPGPEPKHLLSGIAICGKCRKGLRHKVGRGRQPEYVCNTGHVSRLASELDEAVTKELFALMQEVDPADFDADDPTVAAAIQEVQRLESELADWVAAAGRGEVTPASFASIERSIRARIDAARARTAGKQRLYGVDVAKLAKNWKKGTVRQRRELIRGTLHIEVVPGGSVRITRL